MDEQDILTNRASLESGVAKNVTCDKCASPLIFAMKDNHHTFSLDLLTVLQCLKLSESEGAVPPLPESWWLEIRQAYNL